MAGSSFGNIFRMTTWGESHGKGIGVVVDGCPAGIFRQFLYRKQSVFGLWKVPVRQGGNRKRHPLW